ncbi:SDR family oxidoreductase [Arthrobacter sp. UM1]|uniref:SDR family oxidoreductase n=1 Tax=Arthrobacter sp. UM1 TaxID=2766776 RepID=UPI00299D638D|nr:SDR family oxidoreductase [Arthrobacter sp. UM1]MCB4208533.1 SDR family oxidoreductase [Arthrobacter sp. UM1]
MTDMTNENTPAPVGRDREDQLSFGNPVTQFESMSAPEQHQEEPGLDVELTPFPDRGEESYRGTGRLKGRRALVTGGDSGIGAAVAIAFAREGADVAITYLPQEERDAQEIKRLIEAEGRTAVLVPGDLTDREFSRTLPGKAVAGLGGLDILVNNAGKQISVPSLQELTDEQVEETFDVNILAMFRVTRAALEHLPAGSSIINTTSVQAYSPSGHLLDYATTKGAINAFTKGLAEQLAPKGVRVNAVAPGPIWSVLQVTDGQPKEKLPKFGKDTWLGRAGQPVELAPAYVFLASSESSYVVGETLNVNGGQQTP